MVEFSRADKRKTTKTRAEEICHQDEKEVGANGGDRGGSRSNNDGSISLSKGKLTQFFSKKPNEQG